MYVYGERLDYGTFVWDSCLQPPPAHVLIHSEAYCSCSLIIKTLLPHAIPSKSNVPTVSFSSSSSLFLFIAHKVKGNVKYRDEEHGKSHPGESWVESSQSHNERERKQIQWNVVEEFGENFKLIIISMRAQPLVFSAPFSSLPNTFPPPTLILLMHEHTYIRCCTILILSQINYSVHLESTYRRRSLDTGYHGSLYPWHIYVCLCI